MIKTQGAMRPGKEETVQRKCRPFKSRWRTSRRGIAGAVTAVLFVIILTSMFAAIALFYIPSWSKDAEGEHMNKVANQFLTIKDGVNDQVQKGESGSSLYSHVALTSGATTSFLGMQGEPSKGTLRFDSNQSVFEIHDSDRPAEVYAVAKGSLSFVSHNAYYVQQQYYYEEGAVLVRQGTSSTVRDGAPPELHRDAQGCLTLVVTFFTLFGEDTSVTGTGSAGVETRVMHSELTTMPFPSGRNLTLNATSACGDGWAGWVSRSLSANAASENITAQNWSLTRTANGFRLDVMGVANLTIRLAVIELKVSK